MEILSLDATGCQVHLACVIQNWFVFPKLVSHELRSVSSKSAVICCQLATEKDSSSSLFKTQV